MQDGKMQNWKITDKSAQSWNMQDWKLTDQGAGLENACADFAKMINAISN